jgi:vancomycin permeability regulator SanA
MRDEVGARRGSRRWLRWLAIAALAVVALVVGANLYLIATAGPITAASVDSAPVRPYGIVLGNRVFDGGVPSSELAARLETALALHRAGRAAKLVVSGLVKGDYDEPHAMAAWLQARGVPAADIVLDRGGHRTAATMAGSVALGVRSALVVSQGYHLPRALFLARRAGIDAFGVAAETTRSGRLATFWGWLRETTARAEIVVEVTVRGVR